MSESFVTISELSAPAQEQDELDLKAYQIKVQDQEFGRFYVMFDTATLAWNGEVAFSNVQEEALDALPRYLSTASPRSSERPQDMFRVTTALMILTYKEREEFNLGSARDRTRLRNLLKQPTSVRFVRFDVYDASGDVPYEYAFSAENPQLDPSKRVELALRLPGGWSWPPDLVGWIIEHHRTVLDAQPFVDTNELSKTLSTLSHF